MNVSSKNEGSLPVAQKKKDLPSDLLGGPSFKSIVSFK